MGKKEDIENEDNYKRNNEEITDSIEDLQGNINYMLEQIDTPMDDLVLTGDMLPSLGDDIEFVAHDYDRDIELVKIEAKDTLECLANLYLSENNMSNKNIYKIIKDDASQLADLNFSIKMARKALINCMTQLDMGVNDPEMYKSVALFQKEMRDTIKQTYDLQKKMKDFYKELKTELSEINVGMEEIVDSDQDEYTVIGDPKLLNDLLDKYKNDPSLLSDIIEQNKKKSDK